MPALVPFRLKVLRNLTTCFEGITPDAGFQNDMRSKVFRGRLLFSDDDPLPAISILEPPIPPEGLSSSQHNTNGFSPWELLIQGFLKDDPDNPTDPAHILLAEAKAVLVREKRRPVQGGRNILGLGNRVSNMQIGQGSVRPADEISARAYFWLPLTLTIGENLENPYE